MSDPNLNRPEHREAPRSNAPIIFIVGGLVVAVAAIVWFMSGDVPMVADGNASDTTVTIDNSPEPAPAAELAPALEPAPSVDTAPDVVLEPAPAAEPAPADQ